MTSNTSVSQVRVKAAIESNRASYTLELDHAEGWFKGHMKHI